MLFQLTQHYMSPKAKISVSRIVNVFNTRIFVTWRVNHYLTNILLQAAIQVSHSLWGKIANTRIQ